MHETSKLFIKSPPLWKLEGKEGAGMLMLTQGKKKNTQSHTICLRVCEQLQSCHGLTTTKSATAWQSDKRPDEAPRGGGRAPLCAHNTAVGDALLLYEEGEKNHVTPHGFFICWQDELRRRAGAAGAAGRRPPPLALLASCLADISRG